MLRNRKGQSTVEYIILVTAVIAVIIVFVFNPNSPFRQRVNQTFDQATNSMTNMSERLSNSYPVSP